MIAWKTPTSEYDVDRVMSHPHAFQVTLVYHRQLDDSWREAAEKLREALNSAVSAANRPVSLIGRSKNQKLVLGEDFVVERMQVDQRSFVYKQVEKPLDSTTLSKVPPVFVQDTNCMSLVHQHKG